MDCCEDGNWVQVATSSYSLLHGCLMPNRYSWDTVTPFGVKKLQGLVIQLFRPPCSLLMSVNIIHPPRSGFDDLNRWRNKNFDKKSGYLLLSFSP